MKTGCLHIRVATLLVAGGLIPFLQAGLNDVYWSPEDLPSTVMWLDGTDLSTLTTNASGQVSQWRDVSGNSNHASQGSATLQPIAGFSINGLHAIRSDGVDDYMRNSSVTIGSSGDIAVFALAKPVSSSSDGGMLSLVNGFELKVEAGYGVEYFPNYLDFANGPFPGPSVYSISVSTNVTNAWGHVDGLEGLSTDVIQSIGPSTDVAIFSKRGGQAFSSFVDCDIGEVVLVAGDVTVATRQMMEGYLAWKWEIEANLPIGHPYEDRPPGKPPEGTVIQLY